MQKSHRACIRQLRPPLQIVSMTVIEEVPNPSSIHPDRWLGQASVLTPNAFHRRNLSLDIVLA
jgi:hypothetical protein